MYPLYCQKATFTLVSLPNKLSLIISSSPLSSYVTNREPGGTRVTLLGAMSFSLDEILTLGINHSTHIPS